MRVPGIKCKETIVMRDASSVMSKSDDTRYSFPVTL